MSFDFKKEYKEFYMPKGTPSIVTVPKMNYIAVRGSGNPNDEDGEYKQAIGLLYGIAFTIKMSKKGDRQIGSMDTLIMWCLHWKDSGGRMEWPEWTVHIKMLFNGSPSSDCRILLRKKISIGRSTKPRKRRNRISQRWNSSPTMKASVFSACISAHMTMSPLQ